MPNDDLTFKWGRVDCDTSPTCEDEHEFPEPTMTRDEMMAFFLEWFNMDEDEVMFTRPTKSSICPQFTILLSRTRNKNYGAYNIFGHDIFQVVAIMGGHNLGGAARTNSGYSGIWTIGDKARFNTQFYQNLVNTDLTFDNVVSTINC